MILICLCTNATTSIYDVTMIQQYLAGIISFDNTEIYRADVDNNFKVNILDATKIQRFLAKAY